MPGPGPTCAGAEFVAPSKNAKRRSKKKPAGGAGAAGAGGSEEPEDGADGAGEDGGVQAAAESLAAATVQVGMAAAVCAW